jgi:hypothetical protein
LPDEAEAELLAGRYTPGQQAFSVRVGSEYVVYGIDLTERMPWIYIADEYEQISPAPLCLFSVVDSRVPHVWEVHVSDEFRISLGPACLWREGFIEDLLAREPATMDEFRRLTRELVQLGKAAS